MNPLNLIPDKYLVLVKLGVVALGVVLAVIWWGAHNAAQQKIGYDRAMGEVAAAQAKLADEKGEREARAQSAINEEADHAQTEIANLARRLGAARADSERLREQYRAAAERGRRQVACPAGVGASEQAADPLGVLAGLLDRADREAEEVAGYADRLRLAGGACERSFDALSGGR